MNSVARSISVLVACMVLAACGGGDQTKPAEPAVRSPAAGGNGHGHQPAPGAACEPSGDTLSVSADDLKFNKDCLAAPAGRPFKIEFNNMEALPHNVAILPEGNEAEHLFKGELLTGPAVKTYEVPALNSGSFQFHCDVHPEMVGAFIVK